MRSVMTARAPQVPCVLRVTLAEAAACSIAGHATASSDGLETGGLLLGHLHPDRVVVNYAGGPGPLALREPTRFQRDLAHARDLARAAWRLDRGIWLGEWHTHPLGPVTPSDIDLRTYLTHLNDPDLTLPSFLSLIVVAAPDWNHPGIVAWTVTRTLATTTASATAMATAVTLAAGAHPRAIDRTDLP